MSAADGFANAVALLRSWGFRVVEWSGCYGRGNGSDWAAGVPVGHVNHHYVCSLNPDQDYIDGLVANLASGSVVNWFADVHGVAYLVGVGPMNHAGTGNQSVLDRTRNDQPPPGPASAAGSISGNAHYSGTECQHPGDSTPWPGPMLDVMVAINAAEALTWGWTAQRAIDHYEWTNRKIDMSAGGGPDSGGWAGDELRRRVDARMTGITPPPDPGEITMPLSVMRAAGVDYGYDADGMSLFIRIPTEAYYNNLRFLGIVPVDHGKANPVEQNIVDWLRGQVAGSGGRVYEPPQ